MIEAPLEQALWLGALAALSHRHAAYLNAELDALAEQMLRRFRPRARA